MRTFKTIEELIDFIVAEQPYLSNKRKKAEKQ